MNRPTWPLRELVEVEWVDSITEGRWTDVEEHKKTEVGPLRSVGYLIRSDADVVQVAQSMSAVTQHVSDSMTIPRRAVTRLTKIRKIR